jgi:hypothetical protein
MAFLAGPSIADVAESSATPAYTSATGGSPSRAPTRRIAAAAMYENCAPISSRRRSMTSRT